MSSTAASRKLGGRAEKRARVGEPAAAAPASTSPQAVAAAAVDALPDTAIRNAFKTLGLRESWTLRGVCRRWRRIIEETAWTDVELRLRQFNSSKGGKASSGSAVAASDRSTRRKPAAAAASEAKASGGGEQSDAEQSGELAFDGVSELFEQRKLRLGAGASVSLSVELAPGAKAPRQSEQRAVDATCRLLAAVARNHSHSGPAQPRGISLELGAGKQRLSCSHKWVGDYLLGVLRAMQPPSGAPSGLERLCVGFLVVQESQGQGRSTAPPPPWPPAAELRAALAHFGRLRSLALTFDRFDAGVGPEAAAAVAACCPLLRYLTLQLCGEAAGEALAALAPLAHLEELVALFTGGSPVSDRVLALGDGPAGQSLRRVAFARRPFSWGEDLSEEGFDFAPATDAISSAVLHALGRMPKLESIEEMQLSTGRVTAESVRALGRAASLRELSLQLNYGRHELGSPAFPALGEALSGLPRLERLGLALSGRVGSPADVVAVLASAGVRRALTDLSLGFDRMLAEAEAEAILALPALRRLRLDYLIFDDDYLGGFEVLAAGLRPEVALQIESDVEDAGARRGMRELFGARLPEWDYEDEEEEGEEGEEEGSCSGVVATPPGGAAAAGGNPFDALPDELVGRIIGEASASEKAWKHLRAHASDVDQLGPQRARIAQQPSLWERIRITQASDKSVSWLLQQPEERREAIRALFLRSGTLSSDCFKLLCKAFDAQLTGLSLAFGNTFSPRVLTGVSHFSNLRTLTVTGESEAWIKQNMVELSNPLVQAALRTAASLPLETLIVFQFPVLPETLQALAPLAPSLRHLKISVLLEKHSSPGPVLAAVAAFNLLEHLTIYVHNREGQLLAPPPRATEADLQPLSGLLRMQDYEVLMQHEHIGFLRGMRELEAMMMYADGGADFSPLLDLSAAGGSLRSARIYQTVAAGNTAAASTSLASVAPHLSKLETLELLLPPSVYSALAQGQQSLAQWSSLKHLTVRCFPGSATIPGPFLKRLGSDIPVLPRLVVGSPLPFPDEIEAVAQLGRLRQLVLGGKAAEALDAGARKALELLLLRVSVSYAGALTIRLSSQ
eukprot:tig00000269_g23706.t1